jgi:hypothetical protein
MDELGPVFLAGWVLGFPRPANRFSGLDQSLEERSYHLSDVNAIETLLAGPPGALCSLKVRIVCLQEVVAADGVFLSTRAATLDS